MIVTEQHSTSKFRYKYLYKNGVFIATNERYFMFSISNRIKEIFLPQGYPDSVSEDYIEYQVWDTIQAFASTITSTLANQAILKGIGVGDEKATVLGATITWIMKDGAGLIGRILFAYWKGTFLDCNCKQWRLFADVLNDISIFLDICTRYFPYQMFPIIVCISTIGRSLVGVAGSATRAALTLHQAKRNNLADVSAKDGSQESLSNLLGLILNLVVVSLISDNVGLIWITVIFFIVLHLYANYRAVRCVCMTTFNQSRLHLASGYTAKKDFVLSVKEVNLMEPLWTKLKRLVIRNLTLGGSVTQLSKEMKKQFFNAYHIYVKEKYILLLDVVSDTCADVFILLKADSDQMDQLKAVFHAEILDQLLNEPDFSNFKQIVTINKIRRDQEKAKYDHFMDVFLLESLSHSNGKFDYFINMALVKGWIMNPILLGSDEWRLICPLFS